MSESHKAASATSDVMSNLPVKLATLEYEMPQQSQPPTSSDRVPCHFGPVRVTEDSDFKL